MARMPNESDLQHEAEENKRTVLRRFLTFNAICGIGIGLSVLLLNLLYRVAGLNLYLSNLIAIGIVTVWNFGMNAKFNWRAPRKERG